MLLLGTADNGSIYQLDDGGGDDRHDNDLFSETGFQAMKIAPLGHYETHTGAAASVTNQFLELLERQFQIDSPEQFLKLKTAHDFAHSLALHTNHLNRSVKEVIGKTTTRHISERIVKEANALLKHTDWSIAQIANGLGFAEPVYFTNFFKKYIGNAPATSRLKSA